MSSPLTALITAIVSLCCIVQCGGSYSGENPTVATAAPVYQAPSTAALSTQAPSTAAPVYQAPSTAAPSTQAPSTAAPVYQAPSTAAPGTQAPSTAAPVYQAPSTAAPVYQAPSTAAPSTKAPSSAAPGRECKPGAKRFYKCKGLCKCSTDGTRWDCYRQRKEFTTMSRREKKRFIDAYKELSRSTSPYNKEFSEIITNHKVMFMTGIHQKEHFLTWHRWFILQLENLLRKIDCRVTLPYWDWSAVSGDPWGTEPGDLWYAGSSGFGGNGNSTNNFCVTNGPFCDSQDWKPVSSSHAGCDRRMFRGNPPDSVAIMELLETSPANFTDFELALRVYFHDSIHCLVGGTMCSLDSAASPVFFLHHCFVDKIWDDWQRQSDEHKNAYFPKLTEKMPGTDLLPKSVVDNENLPGSVKVEYLEINDTETQTIRRRLKRLSRKQLRELKRPDFDDVNEDAMKLFNVRADEKIKIRRKGKGFKPKNKKNRRRMKSRRGKRRGFDEDDLKEVENRKDLISEKGKYKVQGMRHRRPRPRPRATRRPKTGSSSSPSNSGSKYGGESRPRATRRPKTGSSSSSSNSGSNYGGESRPRATRRPSASSSSKSSSRYSEGSRPSTARPQSTAAPVYQAPSTAAPSTHARSTAAPVYQTPSTAAPSTQAPSTAAPVYQAPSTAAQAPNLYGR